MIPVVLAQEASGGGAGSLIFLVLMVAVFWFLIIRPQRNRQKQQKELASSIEVGDEVQTVGGIKGQVVLLDGDDVILDIEQGRIKMTRRAIANRVEPDEPQDSEST